MNSFLSCKHTKFYGLKANNCGFSSIQKNSKGIYNETLILSKVLTIDINTGLFLCIDRAERV